MYAQQDPRWSEAALGFGPDTIGLDGCYLTSDADLLTWIGHEITPADLNALYTANGIYVEGELLQDSALHDAFPDLWSLEETYHCESVPCDQSKLDNDDPNLYVVVELMGPNGLTHFAPVTDWRNWKIADTWDGQERTIAERGSLWGWGSSSPALVGKVMRYRYVGSGGQAAPAPAAPGSFAGQVAPGGAHVRVLPGTDQPIVAQPGAGDPTVVDGGTTLAFTAWCHHTPRGGADVMPTDAWTGTPDDRWFQTAQGHWIASATIKGNPPAGMAAVADPSSPVAPSEPGPGDPTAPSGAGSATPPAPVPEGPPAMPSYREPWAFWRGEGVSARTPNRRDRPDATGWDHPGSPSAPLTGPSYDLARGCWVVLHHMAGTLAGADARFHDASQQASAHYGVLRNGVVVQWVDEADASWGAGNYFVNVRAINLEVEDNGADQYTDVQLATLVELLAGLAKRYGVPMAHGDVRAGRFGVIRHREVPDGANPAVNYATACPGTLPLDELVSRAAAAASSRLPSPPPASAAPSGPSSPASPSQAGPAAPQGPAASFWSLLVSVFRALFRR